MLGRRFAADMDENVSFQAFTSATEFYREVIRKTHSVILIANRCKDFSFWTTGTETECHPNVFWRQVNSKSCFNITWTVAASTQSHIFTASLGRTLVRTESRELVRVVHGKSERVTLQSPKAGRAWHDMICGKVVRLSDHFLEYSTSALAMSQKGRQKIKSI